MRQKLSACTTSRRFIDGPGQSSCTSFAQITFLTLVPLPKGLRLNGREAVGGRASAAKRTLAVGKAVAGGYKPVEEHLGGGFAAEWAISLWDHPPLLLSASACPDPSPVRSIDALTQEHKFQPPPILQRGGRGGLSAGQCILHLPHFNGGIQGTPYPPPPKKRKKQRNCTIIHSGALER